MRGNPGPQEASLCAVGCDVAAVPPTCCVLLQIEFAHDSDIHISLMEKNVGRKMWVAAQLLHTHDEWEI